MRQNNNLKSLNESIISQNKDQYSQSGHSLTRILKRSPLETNYPKKCILDQNVEINEQDKTNEVEIQLKKSTQSNMNVLKDLLSLKTASQRQTTNIPQAKNNDQIQLQERVQYHSQRGILPLENVFSISSQLSIVQRENGNEKFRSTSQQQDYGFNQKAYSSYMNKPQTEKTFSQAKPLFNPLK